MQKCDIISFINQTTVKKHMEISWVTLGLIILSPLWAACPIVKAATIQGENIPLLTTEHGEKLDDYKDLASNKLLEAAEWLDSFFDDSRSTSEENKTRGTVKLSTGYSRNDDLEFKPRFSLRLKLPRLSRRALLIIQGSDDEDFDIESNPVSNPSTSHEDSKYNDITVGLRQFLVEAERYNLSVDGGVSWDYLYAGVRFRNLQRFGDWQGRFTNRLRYYTDDGWENLAAYDLETYWDEKWLFRATSSLALREDGIGIPHSQYFRFYQVLNDHQVISYESGIFLNTEPSYQMADLQFFVRHRQRFYRDWLVLEIVPSVTFPKDHDYEFNPGIMFKFEATIGYSSDTEIYKKIFRGVTRNQK